MAGGAAATAGADVRFVSHRSWHGGQEVKGDLADYLSKPGAELTELVQMDEQDLDDDILEDDDLGFDEEMKARFRAAVAELKQSVWC